MPDQEEKILAFERRLITLERNLLSSRQSIADTVNTSRNEFMSDVINCIAKEVIELRYQVVIITKSPTENDYPEVRRYTDTLFDANDDNIIGINIISAQIGEVCKIQITGVQYARIKAISPFTFGDTSSGVIVVGAGLKPNDSAELELDADADNTQFNALEDQHSDDDVILIRFAQGAGGATALEHPFKCEKNTDTSVIVGKDRGLSTYPFRDRIELGLRFTDKIGVGSETVTVSGSGSIYYELTIVGASLTAVLKFSATTVPTPVNGKIFWEIGRVQFSGGAITQVNNSWLGNIIIPSRFA